MRTNNFQGYLAASSQKKGREAAGLSQRDLGHTQQSCQPFCLWVAGQTCPGLLWRPPSSGPSRQCRSVPFLLRGNSVRKLTFPPTPCLSAPLHKAPSEGKASSCLHHPRMGTVNAHHPAWLFLFVWFLCLWSFFPSRRLPSRDRQVRLWLFCYWTPKESSPGLYEGLQYGVPLG